ncbi:winged helix-turn-helix domain-containing protein [Bradyrhizobium sp. UFLA05-109]
MVPRVASSKDVLSFGPFRLAPSERLLTREGAPVELGARALDILIALVSRPNDVIGKNELLSHVWPDVTVEESSLRFHMASLRRALRDGKEGARYISTLAGRGYCFVAPVSRSSDQDSAAGAVAASFPYANLPGRLSHMVGRDEDVPRISTHLIDARLVSIVGIGGVGKTTVAIAVGHHLREAFRGAIMLVDLSMLSDPNLVATAIASMLGLSVHSEDATPALIAYLRTKRMLLILDTCEHLIDAIAALASQIYAKAPQVHILATSREVLQVEGEHVYRLDPLPCPPEESEVMSAAAQTFPAPRLFIERAAASGAHLELSEADVAIVVRICRKLDGVALALELVARRVDAYGLQQIESLLDQSLTLLLLGHRSTTPRQKTLQATLDWSYQLLSEVERVVLRRLAVFVGHFSLDAALAVVTSNDIDQSQVLAAIDSLAGKSMIAIRPIDAMMRYRLLDTTRTYLLNIAIDDTEAAGLAGRHATYYRRWLEQSGSEWPTLSSGVERFPHFAALNNVRKALEWCFGQEGDIEIGIGLAAAAAQVFLAMSLLPECHRWSERAILALDDTRRAGHEEMHLQASLGVSLMFTRGNSEGARAALDRSRTIAEQRDEAPYQLYLMNLLHLFHTRVADFNGTLQYAERGAAIARRIGGPAAMALAHSLLGSSLLHIGDLAGARRELEKARLGGPSARRAGTVYIDFEHYNYADINLARTLWLQGQPNQALERVHQGVKNAASIGHPVALCRALVWGVAVLIRAGDLEGADEHANRLVSLAEQHSLEPYLAIGQGHRGALAIRRGNASEGVRSLQRSLETLHSAHYKLFTTEFNIALAEGLAKIGEFRESLALINEAVLSVTTNGDLIYMPELLRVKGNVLASMPEPNIEEAEAYFTQSLELSRQQEARAWELRTAIDLARLWANRGKSEHGRTLLQPILEQFVEGRDTADPMTAARLLAELEQHQ